MRLMQRLIVTVLAAAATISLAAMQTSQADTMLEAAKKLEVVDGNYAAAIRQYQAIVDKFGQTDPRAAATALLRMADCYEKTGNAQVRATLEKLVRDYGTQSAQVAEAKSKLASLASPVQPPNSSPLPSQQQIVAWGGDMVYQRSLPDDGKHLLLINVGHLYVQDVTRISRVPRLGLGDDGAEQMVRRIVVSPSSNDVVTGAIFSPDGKQVAYLRSVDSNVRLELVRPDGSGPRVVKDFGRQGIRLASWSPDTRRVLILAGSSIQWVSLADGEITPVNTEGFTGRPIDLGLSADGRFIAFAAPPRGLFTVPAMGGPVTELVAGEETLIGQWSPDNRGVLYLRRGGEGQPALWRIPVSEGQADGPPHIVLPAIRRFLGMTRSGDYFYQTTTYTKALFAVEIDLATSLPASRPRNLANLNGSDYPGTWSADGKSFVYGTNAPQPTLVFSGSNSSRVPIAGPARFLFGLGTDLQWFPDGKSLLVSDGSGTYRVDTATGASERVEAAKGAMTPDGQTLFYWQQDRPNRRVKILRRPIDRAAPTEICEVSADSIFSMAVSTDGTKLAFVTHFGVNLNPGTYRAIMTVPAEGGAAREIARPAERARHIVWARDGAHVLYATAGDIWSLNAATPGAKPVRFNINLHALSALDISSDGKRLMFLDEDYTNELWRGRLPARK